MKKEDMILSLSKMKFKLMKKSPEILMVVGGISFVGTTILVGKETLKISKVIDKTKKTIEQIHETSEDKNITDYTKDDAKKDLKIVYASTALDIAKAYLPSIILGGISLGCFIQAHNVLNRRNAALTAAFTTVTESFARYRKNVVEKYGEKIDRQLRHNIVEKTIEKKDEKGKTIKDKVEVMKQEAEEYSDYARFYDDGCAEWSKDPEYNAMFLKAQQAAANDKLIAQGYLFLNDVYEMLGIPKSKAGQVVGWVYDKNNPVGDNYVDFGMYDVTKQNAKDFINGFEPTIILDFNVDGNIWDKM